MDENPEESFLLAILNELPQTVGDIPGFALNVTLNHVLPSVLFSAAFFVLYVAGQKMSVKLYPPSAEERYKDAVAMLKKDSSADDDGSSEGSASSKREDALEIIWAAIEMDPGLEDAYITLATELIYGSGEGKKAKQDAQSALTLLVDAKKRFPENEDVAKLMREAKAVIRSGKKKK